jgi:hypothetical protein
VKPIAPQPLTTAAGSALGPLLPPELPWLYVLIPLPAAYLTGHDLLEQPWPLLLRSLLKMYLPFAVFGAGVSSAVPICDAAPAAPGGEAWRARGVARRRGGAVDAAGRGGGQSEACCVARTLAVWQDDMAMLSFVASAAHTAAMARITDLSRGGSTVTHWLGDEASVDWAAAARRIGEDDGPLY